MSKLNEEQIAEIIEKKKNGMGTIELAKAYSVNRNSITKLLKKHNLLEAKPEQSNKKIEFSQDQINDISKRFENGENRESLGEAFNTSAATISRLLQKLNVKRLIKYSSRIYQINEDYFDSMDTQEKAYVLGFIYADGCNMPQNKRFGITLNIKDIALVERFSKIFFQPGSERINYGTSNVPLKNGTYSKSAGVTIYSNKMCQRLIELGVPRRKSKILTYPKWLDKKYQWKFLLGMLDGDGCIYISKSLKKNMLVLRVMVTLIGTNDICNGVRNMVFEELGIRSEIVKSSCEGLSTIKFKGYARVIRLLTTLYKTLQRFYNPSSKKI